MLDTPCFEVVWRVVATHSIRQFPLHFSPRASPCAVTFQLDSTLPLCLHGIKGRATAQAIADLSPRRSVFEPRPKYVVLCWTKFLCDVSLLVLLLSPVSIIPPTLHSHSFVCHRTLHNLNNQWRR